MLTAEDPITSKPHVHCIDMTCMHRRLYNERLRFGTVTPGKPVDVQPSVMQVSMIPGA